MAAGFEGEQSSSDGGGLLLREVERRLNVISRLAGCFGDLRDATRVEHSVEEMLRQRLFSLALGYEDLSDHEDLRKGPMLRLIAGKRDQAKDLAGKSTLNRLELGTGTASRYKKITFWREATNCCWTCSWKVSANRYPKNWCSIWMRPTCRRTAARKGGSSTVITDTTVICRCTS